MTGNKDPNLAKYFVPVETKQKAEIIDYLRRTQQQISYKVNNFYGKSPTVNYPGNEIAVDRNVLIDFLNNEITCTFQIQDGHFLFKSLVTTKVDKHLITVPTELFKLQRRSDFRVSIPPLVEYTLKIHETKDLKTELKDLSLGGCKVAVKTLFKLDLEEGKEIKMNLDISGFETNHLFAEVRFSKFLPDQQVQLLGLKFVNMDADDMSDLQKALMKIDRIARGKDI